MTPIAKPAASPPVRGMPRFPVIVEICPVSVNEWASVDNGIDTMNTANFLSKDFWHQQSITLRNKSYYLIRTSTSQDSCYSF
jgi:hypothetical protein